MNKLKKIPLLILMLLLSAQVYSQKRDSLDTIKNKLPSNFYSVLSIGLTSPLYRDFATSPLFYRGLGINLNTAWLRRNDKRERIFRVDLGFSALIPRVPKSKLIQPGGLAYYGNLTLYYHQLWKIEALSNEKFNMKVGGALNITQNVRGNPVLQNNAMGLENLSNLMASAQVTMDISRKTPKEYKRFTLKPVKRELRLLVNVGVLNFNYRPGYAYTYDSEMNGTKSRPVAWAFSNYKLTLNGWRINTELEFIKYLPNRNARAWSYVWEAAHAKGRYEPFQMASHRIQYTLYFHSKKR